VAAPGDAALYADAARPEYGAPRREPPAVQQWFAQPGGESQSFNMLADLGRIQCPTLVLGGEDDPIHPIESQADIAAALPADLVQFERFDNCRHAVVPDAPERAMAVIRDFIGRPK
jgi:pimeloyl-ACP methyl ester carboxylesterase